MNHRLPCTGFLFREKPRLPNIRRDKIAEFQIPPEGISPIKQGEDYRHPDGSIIPNRDLTTPPRPSRRSEEHTSELQSLMRISYAVFCLKNKNIPTSHQIINRYIAITH